MSRPRKPVLEDLPRFKAPQLRASKQITPEMQHIDLDFGEGHARRVKVAHTKLLHGGSWSYFECDRCKRLTRVIHLWHDQAVCKKCTGLIHRIQQQGYPHTESIEARIQKLFGPKPVKKRWNEIMIRLRRAIIAERRKRLERYEKPSP